MPSRSSTPNRIPRPEGTPAPRRETTLVVVEFSAAWPRWLRPNHFADATVIAQDHGDNPMVLLDEVSRRAAQLEAMDCPLQTIVVVSNGDTEPTQAAARHSLVRSLLSRVTSLGGKRLVLTVDRAAGLRAQRELEVLTKSFARQARRHGVELSVRIGEAEPNQTSAELLASFARAG